MFWGSQGRNCSECGRLACDTVKACMCILTFWRNILPPVALNDHLPHNVPLEPKLFLTLHASTLKMEVVCSSKKLVSTNKTIRGRVSKWVTNGSKTAVIDVTDLLCVSLGNSRVQLPDSLGRSRACACSEAAFSSQNGDRAWGVYYRRAAFCCGFFCGQNDSMQRIFIKKCFLFTVGSFCCVKQFTSWSRYSLKDVLKSQMMPNMCRSDWDKQSKDFYAAVSTH
jgi:hypothetical protein